MTAVQEQADVRVGEVMDAVYDAWDDQEQHEIVREYLVDQVGPGFRQAWDRWDSATRGSLVAELGPHIDLVAKIGTVFDATGGDPSGIIPSVLAQHDRERCSAPSHIGNPNLSALWCKGHGYWHLDLLGLRLLCEVDALEEPLRARPDVPNGREAS